MIEKQTTFSLLRSNAKEILSQEETIRYIKIAQENSEQSEDAITKIIFSNIGLIFKTIKPYSQYKSTTLDFEDLMSVAILGFIKAIKRFDTGKGYRFSTYVVNSMQYEVWRILENQSMPLRIPGYLQREKYKLINAIDEFDIKKNGEDNMEFERIDFLQKETGYSESKIKKLMSLPKINIYFEDIIGKDTEDTYSEIISLGNDEYQIIENNIDRKKLIEYFRNVLNKREFFVLTSYFGLAGDYPTTKTHESIAQELGITRERVRQNLGDAIKKLRSQEHRSKLSALLTGNGRYK